MSGLASSAPLIILAGGQGTRLRALDATRPKPMVLVSGKPFLHWLLAHYARLGHARYIVSTGYKAELIEEYPWRENFPSAELEFVRESEPLGSGGAVKMIFKNRPFLEAAWVINGDTLLPKPLPKPRSTDEALYAALASDELFDASPNLRVKGDRVISEGVGGSVFDGGAVFVTREAVSRHHGTLPCSLHQFLAPSMAAGGVGFAIVPGTCYDIGTPERYRRFERYLAETSKGPGF
jgi:NDP-sugar pyrophosphorylase family protein